MSKTRSKAGLINLGSMDIGGQLVLDVKGGLFCALQSSLQLL